MSSVPADRPPGSLLQDETIWRERQLWLEEQGYMLRPRFRKNWVPSWGSSSKFNPHAEDAIPNKRPNLIDATHISTGQIVMLKCIYKARHPYEVEIARFFSTEPLASHPRNHCCPLLDVLEPPGEDDVLILVTPLLRPFDKPLMESVGEAVEFMRQIFEGIQFMHQSHVAHRYAVLSFTRFYNPDGLSSDCMDLNIMMDPRDMFPHGFHPSSILATTQHKGIAPYRTRTATCPKYYLIDFGLSRKYDPKDGEPKEDVIFGGDKTVPEFQEATGPMNPFPTDIYYLGNMIRESFLSESSALNFVKPLVDDMVQDDPSKRPTIDVVVQRFETIIQGLSWWTLRSHLPNTKTYGREHWGIQRRIWYCFRAAANILLARKALPRPRV